MDKQDCSFIVVGDHSELWLNVKYLPVSVQAAADALDGRSSECSFAIMDEQAVPIYSYP